MIKIDSTKNWFIDPGTTPKGSHWGWNSDIQWSVSQKQNFISKSGSEESPLGGYP